MSAPEISSEMRNCISMCLDCHAVCTETAGYVLHGGTKHSESQHLVTLLDCAQICLAHADLMARRSPHHAELAQVCADLCSACASQCDEHSGDDAKMKHCADVCRKCEESCRRMASASSSNQQGNTGAAPPQGTGAVGSPTKSSGEGNIPQQGDGAGVTQFT
jgi:hypothetical protein